MPNAKTHAIGAAVAVGAASVAHDINNGKLTARPLLDALAASIATKGPDYLEPALHPNHRQFFHSWTVLLGLGYGVYRCYQWQPEEEWQQILRWALLIGGSAYAVHLLMDSRTPKGLPVI